MIVTRTQRYSDYIVVLFVILLIVCSDCYYYKTSSIRGSVIRRYQTFQEYLNLNNVNSTIQSSSPSTSIKASSSSSTTTSSRLSKSSSTTTSTTSSSSSPSSPSSTSSTSSSSTSSSTSSSSQIKVLAKTETITIELVSSSTTSSTSSSLPSLIFLPGLDGKGDYSFQALSNLSSSFNFYKMTVDASDRSTFLEVTDLIISAINKLDNKPILMGESMGGLFASYVASRRPKAISKLILINPATSYERTFWPTLGPVIASTPKAIFPLVGITALLLTAVEIDQFQRIGQSIISQINSTDTAVQVLNTLLDSANSITTTLAPDTLNWRLTRWLGKGNFYLDNRVENIETPTLILVGKNDKLLPSLEEGRRLKKLMKNNSKVELIELDGKGHAVLDGSYDLADLILTSKTFMRDLDSSDVYCPFPNAIDIKNADKQVGNLIAAVSPVFLTRRADGVIVKGIQDVPTGTSSGRPILFVGNHQLYGADLAIIIKEFIDSKNELVRGLAHPILFMNNPETAAGGMGDPSIRELFTTFGAVKVSGSAIFELLKRNESVLLFPGGVKEAYHLKGEEYKLLWPEKTDFVRMAALFDAIIVPFAAVGIADSVNIVLDANDILSLPVFGDRAREASSRLPQARPGGNDTFIAPISIPKAPSRNYFIFENPIDTRELNVYDKEQSKKFYLNVKQSVEKGISTLLKIRDSDPYREWLPRVAYETINKKEAPVPALNRFD